MMTKKLNLMKMKSKTFLGDSMMRTLKGWFLYKKTFYAICNTRQESPPATWQPIDDGFSVMQGWWQTLVMWKDTWPCTAMQVLCLWPRKVTWKDMELSCTTQMVLPTSCLWTMLRRKTRWLLIANLMTVCKLSNWANTQASKGSRKIWGHNIHKNFQAKPRRSNEWRLWKPGEWRWCKPGEHWTKITPTLHTTKTMKNTKRKWAIMTTTTQRQKNKM